MANNWTLEGNAQLKTAVGTVSAGKGLGKKWIESFYQVLILHIQHIFWNSSAVVIVFVLSFRLFLPLFSIFLPPFTFCIDCKSWSTDKDFEKMEM